jgi:hypothetical protein
MTSNSQAPSSVQPAVRGDGCDRGILGRRAHSTPDPDAIPPNTPKPSPNPDDVPPPVNAPVQEPTLPEPPIKAAGAMAG